MVDFDRSRTLEENINLDLMELTDASIAMRFNRMSPQQFVGYISGVLTEEERGIAYHYLFGGLCDDPDRINQIVTYAEESGFFNDDDVFV